MKAVIQRVKNAEVRVDDRTTGSCDKGLMILLGVAEGDTELDAELLCRKIVNLRIFTDEAGKMNLSLKDIDGEMLVVSQFTLLANYRHGNRPDFWSRQSRRKPIACTNILRRWRQKRSDGSKAASLAHI